MFDCIEREINLDFAPNDYSVIKLPNLFPNK